MKKLFTLLLLLPFVGFGQTTEMRFKPTKMIITEVVLEELSNTNNGVSWDSEVGNLYPDVFFDLYSNRKRLESSKTIKNVTQDQLPLKLNSGDIVIKIDKIKEFGLKFRLRDNDIPQNEHDYIDGFNYTFESDYGDLLKDEKEGITHPGKNSTVTIKYRLE